MYVGGMIVITGKNETKTIEILICKNEFNISSKTLFDSTTLNIWTEKPATKLCHFKRSWHKFFYPNWSARGNLAKTFGKFANF